MDWTIKRHGLIPARSEFESPGSWFRFWGFVFGLSFPGYHIGLNTIITGVIGSNSIDTLLAYGILIGSLGAAILNTSTYKWQKYLQWPVIFSLLAVFLFFLSGLIFPENAAVLTRMRTTYFQTTFWGAFAIGLLEDKQMMKKAFRLIGYIIFFSLVYEPFSPTSTLFIAADNSWGTSGYLTWGYRMLAAAILLIYASFETRKKVDVVFAVLASLEVSIIGNRGSLIAIVIFIMMYVLFCMKTSRKVKYIVFIGGIAAVVLTALTPDNLVKLESVLSSMGIRSRNLSKLLDSSMTDSGRDAGYSIAIEQIKSGNLFGLGVGGDQVLVGNYPHNIVLELLLQYGNILGSILVILLAVEIFICFFGYKDKEWRAMLVVCFCLSIVKLWFSSTYWYELWFWAYMVMIINTRKKMKHEKRYREFLLHKQNSPTGELYEKDS